jgi:pimeloyl-ACP methyl ester carboxylesterase
MGEFITLNGVDTYFEVQGEGDPVVYLHGGLSTIESGAAQIGALAHRYRVYAPERRGHGRTPDTDAPFSYDTMAEDTIAFIREVVGGGAHLVGWSDGGNIGLLLALRQPVLVSRLVVIGSNYRYDGVVPELAAEPVDPNDPGMAFLREAYGAISPDRPDHWPVVVEKLERMVKSEPKLTVEDLARIQAPTLVMVGDDDFPTLAHTISLYESLPHGQLAIIPGASHLVAMEKPELVNQLILDFLAGGEPMTMFPLRRAPAH